MNSAVSQMNGNGGQGIGLSADEFNTLLTEYENDEQDTNNATTTTTNILNNYQDSTGASYENMTTEDLIDLLYALLYALLQKVVQQRGRHFSRRRNSVTVSAFRPQRMDSQQSVDSLVVDELASFVPMTYVANETGEAESPQKSKRASRFSIQNTGVELPFDVQTQLRNFIVKISNMYLDNPFHNFNHAAHVTISAYQLIRRVGARNLNGVTTSCANVDPWQNLPTSGLEATTGLARDALAQFAVVFSALIHDCEHAGVPNSTLSREQTPAAIRYKNVAVAEQNSVDQAWFVLEGDDFQDLRECICPSNRESQRFRQMVVNLVMSTDIADADLREFRDNQWNEAYGSTGKGRRRSSSIHDIDGNSHFASLSSDQCRKATVVMQFVLMASDVSHTMQPFDVYRRWNERLFREMYAAYKQGRGTANPFDFWYKGEGCFYDKHVLPLVEKLQLTGAFGAIADQLYEQAKHNRDEWEKQGLDVMEKLRAELLHEEKPQTNEVALDKQPKQTVQTPAMLSYLCWRVSILCCRSSKPAYMQETTEREESDTSEHEDDDRAKVI
eukprot:Nitzschia sp. Nitz4//scaffold306_size21755//5206//6955//NITZ4_008588-RA/size21755-snap-gene-0.12-mRNA-1//1//CDS//3329547108//9072//frame0